MGQRRPHHAGDGGHRFQSDGAVAVALGEEQVGRKAQEANEGVGETAAEVSGGVVRAFMEVLLSGREEDGRGLLKLKRGRRYQASLHEGR